MSDPIFRGQLDRPTLAGLGRLLDRLGAAMASAAIADKPRRDILVVADELVSNVLNYREGRDRPRVDVVLDLAADGALRLEVRDDSPAFDPFARPDPAVDLALDDRPVGGLGLFLVKSLTRERSYRREPDRNVTTLVFGA